jgi:hypothetical protein
LPSVARPWVQTTVPQSKQTKTNLQLALSWYVCGPLSFCEVLVDDEWAHRLLGWGRNSGKVCCGPGSTVMSGTRVDVDKYQR